MSSGELVAMTEPTAAYSVLKLALTGSASGLTYAVAAVQANPEMAAVAAPDLKTSLYMLAFGVILAAGKTYLPSEKKVDTQFQGVVDEVKTGHKTLSEKLFDLASETKEEARERREHYNMLYRWMGSTDEKFKAMDEKVDDVRGRLTRIERGTGETKRP